VNIRISNRKRVVHANIDNGSENKTIILLVEIDSVRIRNSESYKDGRTGSKIASEKSIHAEKNEYGFDL
jgi:hypothetical protein